jgi:hypothetical protein
MANLIWNDLVKSACFVRSLHPFSTVVQAGEQAPRNSGARADGRIMTSQFREYAASVVAEVAIATVDHSDIRGSKPHNRHPSGAASD